MDSDLSVIILAAGQGTRMRSAQPKVLHQLGGKPMLAHVIDTAKRLHATDIHVVYGHGGEKVRDALVTYDVDWVLQDQQLGTGHAVAQAISRLAAENTALVLYGDVPLISDETLRALLGQVAIDRLALLTAKLSDPTGYGRIVRDAAGRVLRIVEQKDASEHELRINEINTGFLACNAGALRNWVSELKNDNAQGEYYLTDVVELAVKHGFKINTASANKDYEILGVNDRVQLAQLERIHQRNCADALMRSGVTLADPTRFDLRGNLKVAHDVTIDVNVVIEGDVTIGTNSRIGPNVVLRDCVIGENVEVFANSVIEGASIASEVRIGPFARIRPGTQLSDHVHVGNFVEIKKSTIAPRTKINHLSYVGDSSVGADVNIGAGTITCNYDGANKHQTVIGDRVFVGSNSQLVAPVTIGAGATVGAGTTVTKDVPEDVLVISRVPQKVKTGWRRPQKVKPTDGSSSSS